MRWRHGQRFVECNRLPLTVVERNSGPRQLFSGDNFSPFDTKSDVTREIASGVGATSFFERVLIELQLFANRNLGDDTGPISPLDALAALQRGAGRSAAITLDQVA